MKKILIAGTFIAALALTGCQSNEPLTESQETRIREIVRDELYKTGQLPEIIEETAEEKKEADERLSGIAKRIAKEIN